MAKISMESVANKAGVSMQYLEEEFSDDHVLDFARLCPNYEVIAPFFKLPQYMIDDIAEEKANPELRRRALLQKWKGHYSFEATYKKFLQALIDCGKRDTAYEVCKILAKEEKGEYRLACVIQ